MRGVLVSLSIAILVATASGQAPEPVRPPIAVRAAGHLDDFWTDLAGADAAKAYRAIWALTRTAKETVAYFARKLTPTATPDARKVQSWIEDLNSDTFVVREKANQELSKLGVLVEPALRRALATNPSLEMRKRVEKLVELLDRPLGSADLRAIRAVETLEHIGTAEAGALLARYAAGAARARLTDEAKQALARLAKTTPSIPSPIPALTPPKTDLYGDPLPLGAVGRLGTIRFRGNATHGLAFLHGGKELIICGQYSADTQEVSSGRLLHSLPFESLTVRHFAMARDGKQFAIAGNNLSPQGEISSESELRVYALPSGKLLKSLQRQKETGIPQDLAFSPDGKILFSLHLGYLVRVAEIATGRELARREFPKEYGNTMAVSNDGAYVAVSSSSWENEGKDEGKIVLWKWQTDMAREFKVPEHGPTWISFSPDGKLLAGIDRLFDENRLHMWEVPSGRLLYHHHLFSENEFRLKGEPTFTPDGKTLAVMIERHLLHGGRIILLDPATGRTQGSLDNVGGLLLNFAISDDSRRLAVYAGDTVHIWDLAARKELPSIAEAHQNQTTHLIASSGGLLVLAGLFESVRVWDAGTSKQLRMFPTPRGVRAMAVAPDGHLVAASTMDDAVHIWDGRSGKEIHLLPLLGKHGWGTALAFQPDGRGLVTFGIDFDLQMWNVKTGKATLEHPMFEHPIRPEGIQVQDKVELRANPRAFSEFISSIGSVRTAITRDAKTLVVDVGKHIHLFDTATGKATFKIPKEATTNGILVLSPSGKHLLAVLRKNDTGNDRSISLLDLSTGKIIQRHVLDLGIGEPVAFSEDGRMFAVGMYRRKKILLIETASGEIRGTIPIDSGGVTSLAFCPDGRRLASGSTDSSILLWDLSLLDDSANGP